MNIEKTLTVPIITPMKNGALDLDSLGWQFQYLVEHHVDSILLFGTTGEFPYLSFEQKREILDTITELNVGWVVDILLWVSSWTPEATAHVLGLWNQYDDDTGIVANVVTPLYGKWGPELQIDLAMSMSSRDILLYNNPNIQWWASLDPRLIYDFAQIDQITWIKDTSWDIQYFQSLIERFWTDMNIYQWRERIMLDTMGMNIAWIISGNANAGPEEFAQMVCDPTSENITRVAELKKQLWELSSNYIEAMKIYLAQKQIISSAQLVSN